MCEDKNKLVLKKYALNSNSKLCILTDSQKYGNGYCQKLLMDLAEPLKSRLIDSELEQSDLILLFVEDIEWGLETVKSIKSNVKQFLKPIIVCYMQRLGNLDRIADVTIKESDLKSNLSEKISKALKISNKVKELPEISEDNDDIDRQKLIFLQYLYTRDSYRLTPERDYTSSSGYNYPLLQFLPTVVPNKEIHYLDSLKDARFLSPTLVDKINICPHCEHIQINYREVCTHCHSLDIFEEPSIHHYRCAYVGRESEFRKGLDLVCPKCSKDLKHIGVDYDKPIDILWCAECKNKFTEPLLICFCLYCAESFPPEEALIVDINEYTLSPEGQQAAEEGLLPNNELIDIFKNEFHFYHIDVFREFLHVELFRCQRYQYCSTLALLSLSKTPEADQNGKLRFTNKFRNDLAEALRSTFREPDLFTELSNDYILIIFSHTSPDDVQIAFERLKDNIATVFDEELDLKYRLIDLQEESLDVHKVLGELR